MIQFKVYGSVVYSPFVQEHVKGRVLVYSNHIVVTQTRTFRKNDQQCIHFHTKIKKNASSIFCESEISNQISSTPFIIFRINTRYCLDCLDIFFSG